MFAERRRRFMEAMEGGVALFFAAPEKVRSNDTHYRYRQDSDFHYLTGFGEPDSVALLMPNHPSTVSCCSCVPGQRAGGLGRAAGRTRANGPPTPPPSMSWTPCSAIPGERPLSLSRPRPIIRARSSGLAALDKVKAKIVWASKRRACSTTPGWFSTRCAPQDPGNDIMRQAATISSEGHRTAMQMVRPGVNSTSGGGHRVRIRAGATAPAYRTIVGSG
jgi:Xaa-Pro aminopeptidase